MNRYNFKLTEGKWQSVWEKNKFFKSKRDNNNKENILFKTPETFKKEFNKNIKITLDASFDKINFFKK